MLLYIAYIAVAALLRARRRQISRGDLPPVIACCSHLLQDENGAAASPGAEHRRTICHVHTLCRRQRVIDASAANIIKGKV